MSADPITVEAVEMRHGDAVVQHGLNFSVRSGEVFAVVGRSGSGKSTLLRHLIGLQAPARGRVLHQGVDLYAVGDAALQAVRRRFGVMFQAGALWSSMTVGENLLLPMQLFTTWSAEEQRRKARFKLALVGLDGSFERMPSELSGGMRKRAAIARALALDPALLFLDEPGSGLDPVNAARLDELVLNLRHHLGTTVVMVTHEIASVLAVADRVLYLDEEEQTMTALDTPLALRDHGPPKVREFFARGAVLVEPALAPTFTGRRAVKANPLRVGLFVVVGTAILVAAVVLVGGGWLFARMEPVVMHFPGSVYGLQPGAPVVFRGVRVGSVQSVNVELGVGGSGVASAPFTVPVRGQIDRSRFSQAAPGSQTVVAPSVRDLVQRGLVARLSTQSLLTGQLYVDLDFGPVPVVGSAGGSAGASASGSASGSASVSTSLSAAGSNDGATVVPTAPDAMQSWLQRLQAVDVQALVGELTRTATSARELVADPALRRSVTQLGELTFELQQATRRLDARLATVAAGATSTLGETRTAATQLGQAAQQLGRAADQVAGAASGAAALMAPGSPTLGSIQRATDELAQSAAALRSLAGAESPLATSTEATLAEMKRASRAVRELAELLEREPQSLLRGRSGP